MSRRARLEGVKAIAFFVASITGQSYSASAVTRATSPKRADPLPVHYGHGGFVFAFEDDVRAWAERPGERRRPRQRRAAK